MPIDRRVPPPPRNTRFRLTDLVNAPSLRGPDLEDYRELRERQREREREEQRIREQDEQRARDLRALEERADQFRLDQAINSWHDNITHWYEGQDQARHQTILDHLTPALVRAVMNEPEATICGVCSGPNCYADDLGWHYVSQPDNSQVVACHGCVARLQPGIAINRAERADPRPDDGDEADRG